MKNASHIIFNFKYFYYVLTSGINYVLQLSGISKLPNIQTLILKDGSLLKFCLGNFERVAYDRK